MNFQIINTESGYIVSVHCRFIGDTYDQWHPLRKFKNEGDAKIFRERAERLNFDKLRSFAKSYDAKYAYKINGRRYVRINKTEKL